MEAGQEIPTYLKVILTIVCIAGLFLVSAYPKLWEWTQLLLKKIDIRQLGRAAMLSIREVPGMLRRSQKIYLTRPRAL